LLLPAGLGPGLEMVLVSGPVLELVLVLELVPVPEPGSVLVLGQEPGQHKRQPR